MRCLRRRMLALPVLLLCSPASQAQDQDVYVPGTGVSYNISRDHQDGANSNTSTLYVDEVNDTTNKNFVGFTCEQGKPYFFLASKNPLITPQNYKSGQYPTLSYQADGGAVRTVPTQPWGEGESFEPNRLLVEDANDPVMFRLFRDARSKVVLKVRRPGQSELVFTFATAGFQKGYQAIGACR